MHTKLKQLIGAGALVLIAFTLTVEAQAQSKFITVASTTSTENSGLFGHILPLFKAKTGIDVHVIAQGTGQALKTGERGDADVVFVHDTQAELKFVKKGFGIDQREVMYNDFIVIGPNNDPAGIHGVKDITAGLKKIAARKAPFVSRGDNSGTHKAELRLWKVAGIDVKAVSGKWYRETGSGMGETLNTAAAMQAYALTDRGTWLSFKNRGDLAIQLEGDRRLFNQYGVMLVNPAKHPHVKQDLGRAFINWITSPAGQKAIADYKINGKQLFFPNAKRP